MEQMGIKDTKEAIVGVLEIALFIKERIADGLGMDDAMAVWDKVKNDEDFKSKVVAAYEGYANISQESKDYSIEEYLEMTNLLLSYIPRFLKEAPKA